MARRPRPPDLSLLRRTNTTLSKRSFNDERNRGVVENPKHRKQVKTPGQSLCTLDHCPLMDPGHAAYFSDFDETQHSHPKAHAQPHQSRPRRRQSSTSDGPKHRRTRSGCYTCRQRRVKCDETHPICERCRKGKRDCTYPPNIASTPSTASSTAPSRGPRGERLHKGTSSDGQSSPSVCDDDTELLKIEPLAAIVDNEDAEMQEDVDSSQHSTPMTSMDRISLSRGPGSTTTERKRSNRTEKQHPYRSSTSRHSKEDDLARSEKWQQLPKEMDAYLRYHRDHLTYHHYAFKCDRSDFLKTTFLEIALNDDSSALLYAIIAFAAYHHTIHRARDSWQTFLTYYNKAIEALNPLLKSRRHNTATLLTILQLATIEEFLGDWLNLDFHKRAAVSILTEIYRVETIMQDETRRKIVMWFCRFDVFSSILSGHHPCLSREWYAACAKFYAEQALSHPEDTAMIIEDFFAASRLAAADVAFLFADKKQGRLMDGQFSRRVTAVRLDIDAFKHRVESTFQDDSCFAKVDEISALGPDEVGIVSYREPRILYSGDYFIMNFVLLDYLALELVFEYQLELLQGRRTSSKLVELSLQTCKMVEAIHHSTNRPDAVIFSYQASLAIIGLFVSTNRKRVEWCRRKLAMVESVGFIYPARVHQQMTRLWGEDVVDWWLPNGARLTPTIRMIKEFAEFRKVIPTDLFGVNICDMNGMFRSSDGVDSSPRPTESHFPRVDSGYGYEYRGIWNFQREPVTTSG